MWRQALILGELRWYWDDGPARRKLEHGNLVANGDFTQGLADWSIINGPGRRREQWRPLFARTEYRHDRMACRRGGRGPPPGCRATLCLLVRGRADGRFVLTVGAAFLVTL